MDHFDLRLCGFLVRKLIFSEATTDDAAYGTMDAAEMMIFSFLIYGFANMNYAHERVPSLPLINQPLRTSTTDVSLFYSTCNLYPCTGYRNVGLISMEILSLAHPIPSSIPSCSLAFPFRHFPPHMGILAESSMINFGTNHFRKSLSSAGPGPGLFKAGNDSPALVVVRKCSSHLPKCPRCGKTFRLH